MNSRSLFVILTLIFSFNSLNASNFFERWFFGVSNNDPRVLASNITGGALAVVGILVIKKGIEQTFAPFGLTVSLSLKFLSCCVMGLISRLGGACIATTGCALTTGGLGLLFFSQDLLIEFEKWKLLSSRNY